MKSPYSTLRCGECSLPMYGGPLRAWCANKHCKQVHKEFVILMLQPQVLPVPEPEKEYA